MQNSIQQKMFEGIRRWQQSGLKQKAWCEQNGVPYSSFHYWYKRYRNGEPVADKNSSEGFVQLMVNTNRSGIWCELELAGAKKLVFHQSVSAEFLRALIG